MPHADRWTIAVETPRQSIVRRGGDQTPGSRPQEDRVARREPMAQMSPWSMEMKSLPDKSPFQMLLSSVEKTGVRQAAFSDVTLVFSVNK